MKREILDSEQAQEHANRLTIVAEPTRLRLLVQLMTGPATVSQISRLLALPLAKISHHLNVLLEEGLVEFVPEGRQKIYQLNKKAFVPSTDRSVFGSIYIGPCFLQLMRLEPYRLRQT